MKKANNTKPSFKRFILITILITATLLASLTTFINLQNQNKPLQEENNNIQGTVGVQETLQPRNITVPDNYSSIQEAIQASKDGDTIFIKQGTYKGPVNQTLFIQKSISIIGENPTNTIIHFYPPKGPYQIFTQTFIISLETIIIEADDLKLSGLTIISDGGRIKATGDRVQISNNIITTHPVSEGKVDSTGLTIDGVHNTIANNNLTGKMTISGSHHNISQNYFENNRTMVVENTASYSTFEDNRIIGFSSVGDSNTITGNTLYTLLEVTGDKNIVSNNNSTYLTVKLDGSNNVFRNNKVINFEVLGDNNLFVANYMQSLYLGVRNRNVVNFTFYNNFLDFPQIELREGLKIFRVRSDVDGPIFLDNGSEGNYWCDYNGTDSDRDGIGDTPYVIYTSDILNHHCSPSIADVADMVLVDHFPLMSPLESTISP